MVEDYGSYYYYDSYDYDEGSYEDFEIYTNPDQ